ncbi:MAG: hypothetical protein WC871_03560 [Bacteroidales bacterium]|jgi:hypothetical protein
MGYFDDDQIDYFDEDREAIENLKSAHDDERTDDLRERSFEKQLYLNGNTFPQIEELEQKARAELIASGYNDSNFFYPTLCGILRAYYATLRVAAVKLQDEIITLKQL